MRFSPKLWLDGTLLPRSKLTIKTLVNAVVQTVTQPSDTIAVAMFNQSNAVSKSPTVIYQGAGKQNVSQQLSQQSIAKKSDKAYADTDFKEAVVATITGPFAKNQALFGFLLTIKIVQIMMQLRLNAIKNSMSWCT